MVVRKWVERGEKVGHSKNDDFDCPSKNQSIVRGLRTPKTLRPRRLGLFTLGNDLSIQSER